MPGDVDKTVFLMAVYDNDTIVTEFDVDLRYAIVEHVRMSKARNAVFTFKDGTEYAVPKELWKAQKTTVKKYTGKRDFVPPCLSTKERGVQNCIKGGGKSKNAVEDTRKPICGSAVSKSGKCANPYISSHLRGKTKRKPPFRGDFRYV